MSRRLRPFLRRLPKAWPCFTLLCLTACPLFEFSPFQTGLEADRTGLNSRNLARLQASLPVRPAEFTFAVFADIQGSYDELDAAVRHINSDTSIRMVVLPGDLTRFGLLREFQWVADFLSGLRAPWLTAIGNHDAQANGRKVYRRMFGPLNYAAAFAGMKFIFYNSNAWEFPCCVPDLGWLENQLRDAGDSLTTFCVSHIIPYGDQLDSAVSHSLEDLMEDYRVTLSIHGHQHNWHYGRLLEEDGLYLIVDDIGARNYAKVTVSGVRVEVERIYF